MRPNEITAIRAYFNEAEDIPASAHSIIVRMADEIERLVAKLERVRAQLDAK